MSDEKKRVSSDNPSLVPQDSGTNHLALGGLLLAVLVAVGLFFLWQVQRSSNEGLTKALADETASRKISEEALKKQFSEFGQRLELVSASAQKLAEDKDALEKALALNKEELAAKVEELRQTARQEIAAVGEGVNSVKDDFRNLRETSDTEKGRMNKKLTQVDDDFNYIKDELGKKAEKSYLKFLKRDLMNEIGQVSENLDSYKTEVDGKLKTTDEKLQLMGSALEQRVDRKVGEATKLNFVTTDEEGKVRKPLPDDAPAEEGAAQPAVEEVPAEEGAAADDQE
jgi:DNA anti-recombination protein RmuC